jgi:hypothetical protein
MGVTLHLSCPLEKAPEFAAFTPHEFPKFQKADLGHFHAGISLNTPQQVGTAPRGQAMALRGIPKEPELVAHALIITINIMKYTKETSRAVPGRTAEGGCPHMSC